MSSASVSTATLIDPAILDTVLGRLALLFLAGAGEDITVARHAALQLLAAYKVETDEELSLAAEVVSFGYHALQALSQAMEPDLSLNKILRLRGSAVSLSRESHRNQRKLDQLQRDRRAAADAPPADTLPRPTATSDTPTIDQPTSLNASARQTVEAKAAKTEPVQAKTWTQAYHDRQRDKRLAESARKRDPLTFVPAQPGAVAACSAMAIEAAVAVSQTG